MVRDAYRGRGDLYVLADANARLGSQLSASVGGHAREEENLPGVLCHAFLQAFQLWVPSTTAECYAGGPTWTWQSALGPRHRIDYVAVPRQRADSGTVSAFTLPTFDMVSPNKDHIPAAVRFVLRPPAVEPPIQRRALDDDPAALDDPATLARCAGALSQCPTIPWDADRIRM